MRKKSFRCRSCVMSSRRKTIGTRSFIFIDIRIMCLVYFTSQRLRHSIAHITRLRHTNISQSLFFWCGLSFDEKFVPVPSPPPTKAEYKTHSNNISAFLSHCLLVINICMFICCSSKLFDK